MGGGWGLVCHYTQFLNTCGPNRIRTCERYSKSRPSRLVSAHWRSLPVLSSGHLPSRISRIGPPGHRFRRPYGTFRQKSGTSRAATSAPRLPDTGRWRKTDPDRGTFQGLLIMVLICPMMQGYYRHDQCAWWGPVLAFVNPRYSDISVRPSDGEWVRTTVPHDTSSMGCRYINGEVI